MGSYSMEAFPEAEAGVGLLHSRSLSKSLLDGSCAGSAGHPGNVDMSLLRFLGV